MGFIRLFKNSSKSDNPNFTNSQKVLDFIQMKREAFELEIVNYLKAPFLQPHYQNLSRLQETVYSSVGHINFKDEHYRAIAKSQIDMILSSNENFSEEHFRKNSDLFNTEQEKEAKAAFDRVICQALGITEDRLDPLNTVSAYTAIHHYITGKSARPHGALSPLENFFLKKNRKELLINMDSEVEAANKRSFSSYA